jgi:hypothetical protein
MSRPPSFGAKGPPEPSAAVILLAVVISFGLAFVHAEDPTPPSPQQAADTTAADAHPELRRLSKTDDIWLDMAAKRVVVGGQIALNEGEIEVFACPQLSKEHEAIVATRCPARLVHAGLLAIGLTPGSPVSFNPEYVQARGPKVAVRVRWQDADGGWQERPAQEWIQNTKTGQQLQADWIFAGSSFWRDPADDTEHYQADGGDMICVSNFPSAMLDLTIESSESNEALLFRPFPDRVPPVKTKVELILSAAE